MTLCPNCRHETPDGNFCVRCGQELSAPEASRRRSSFAAAPKQSPHAPRLISTLFPQLPHADMWTFQVALATGAAVVAALTIAGVYALAIVAGAVLLPLISLIYFYDVDVYEDQPLLVLGVTLAWGVAAGVAYALVLRELAPVGADLLGADDTTDRLLRGVVFPLASVLLIAAGPLALLRYRRFNDVLDGAQFGAAAAAGFVGATTLVTALPTLRAGFEPAGDALPWLARVATLALASPILSMAAVGAAVGAFWLRYRGPSSERGALGVIGVPAVAAATAGAAVLAGAAAIEWLPGGWALAVNVGLALLALLWLRRTLHLGLLQEASEREIGPDIVCANCGETTARHTYCSSCGIALAALPKPRAARSAPAGGAAPEPGS